MKYIVLLSSLSLLLCACAGDYADTPPAIEVPAPEPEDDPVLEPSEVDIAPDPGEISGGTSDGHSGVKPKPGEGKSDPPKEAGPEKGELLYAIPDSMKVMQIKRVEVRIVRGLAEDNVERLTDRLKDTSRVVINVIETSETMRIRLREEDPSDPKFRIDTLTSEEQIIPKGGIGYWSWNIKPLVAGEHKLIITAGIKKKSEETGEIGYRYAPIWEEDVAVAAVEQVKEAEEAPNWLAIGGGASLLIALLVSIGLWRSKSQKLLSPPLIQREKLDFVEDLIMNDKLEAALDEMEGLVKVVRDKEHNLIIGLKAELNSFNNRYNGGEISYEELSKVKARIRRAIVEMNDRLGGEATEE